MVATRTFYTIAIILGFIITGLAGVATAEPTEGTVYGDGVTLEQATPIATLLADAETYKGKKVRVDGVVTAVCEKRGCWMQLADPESGDAIRIKVDDGAIVFPVSAKGHKASAEGTFDVIERPADAHGKHGDCQGEGCDHKTEAGQDCKHKGEAGHDCQGHKGSGKPCAHHGSRTVYLIRGTGAVVY